MKQLELQLNKRLLIVEGSEIQLSKEGIIYKDENSHVSDLIEGVCFNFICRGCDLTEEVAEDFVQIFDLSYFVDYNGYSPRCYVDTALESFISAIESKGYYWGENPMQKTKPTSDLSFYDTEEDYKTALAKWQEAESRTFNPSKCIIFEIV